MVAGEREVSEFQLFEDAYRCWHGSTQAGSAAEQAFSRYLATGQAPVWVRHYVRDYIKENRPVFEARHRDFARSRLIEYALYTTLAVIVVLCIGW